ncbi:hypothetical protein ACIRL2_33385 [Embleya sp. NPDC127516]|uniref:hypothetical protein n=1 Tax=Embleya sp. NPDC127516 TaxID=3363990 RepID=UPI0038178243
MPRIPWDDPIALPVGAAADRWLTVRPERTVLGVIHNVTSATRLLDLLRLFEGDTRIQTVFTCTGSSAFEHGIPEFVRDHGLVCLPWAQAIATKFDLAITTSRGGDLHRINAPIIGTPHGMGYNKILRQEAGSSPRPRETASPGSFGLTAEWLTHDGAVVPSAVVLSHDEQLSRLAEGCPEALPSAVVAGDPCLDELRAGLPFRDDYRAAWGMLPGQKLVVVSSTWSRESQLGKSRDVLRHVLATLPRDEFRVAAVIHPNVWYAHSPWQVRSWLAPLQSAGLTLVRPEGDGWKAALVAADALIGDYGSVTFYGAALGLPTLLSGIPADGTLAESSPIARLLPLLPRVDATLPLPRQLDAAERRLRTDPAVAEVTANATSLPGGSARTLRTLFYDRLGLNEPAEPVVVRPVEVPDARSVVESRRSPVAPASMSAVTFEGDVVALRRYPAHLAGGTDALLTDAHLVVDEAEPDDRLRLRADVVVGRPPASAGHLAELLRAHPGCRVAALPDGVRACVVGTSSGWRATVRWESADPRMSAAVVASAVYGRSAGGGDPTTLSVRLGDLVVPLDLTEGGSPTEDFGPIRQR